MHKDINPDHNIDCSTLKNYKSIGSYNWSTISSTKNPIIVVPGKPTYLSGRLEADGCILKKKGRKEMVDENRYYLPEYPMEPLFRTVKKCAPNFDFKNIDFVTDRNGLRKLYKLPCIEQFLTFLDIFIIN